MNFWAIFPTICGYERVGPDRLRLYVEGPTPESRLDRPRGVRTSLFRLYAGGDAEAVLSWLDRNKAWQILRVPPPFTAQMGVRAVLVASEWHCGEASALFELASTRIVSDHDHRERIRQEVHWLIESAIENPVHDEFERFRFLEDVINVAPEGTELCSPCEIVAAFFGSA